jgi:hypothetical protein
MPPTREEVGLLHDALRAAGRDPDCYEVGALAGTETSFPVPDQVKPLAPTIGAVAEQLVAGVATVFLKPSQFIDDTSQLEEFSHEAVARLAELWQHVEAAGPRRSENE